MSNDRLWAPWRLAYITEKSRASETDVATAADDQQPPPVPPGKCFLCHYLETDTRFDRPNLLLHRGTHTVSVLNRYPYNNGHILVAPRDHKAGLADLSTAELLECQTELVAWTAVLSTAFKAQGFNIGLNLGAVAGAGLPGHLHWHIVPRWAGDQNFMPVTAATQVLPQSLDTAWEILVNARSS
jgi:ATP adenylyltransferase